MSSKPGGGGGDDDRPAPTSAMAAATAFQIAASPTAMSGSHLPSPSPSPSPSPRSSRAPSPDPDDPKRSRTQDLARAPSPGAPADEHAMHAMLTKLVEFFATATPNTLAAVGAAFALVTYLVLGQLGLVLMGAFGGVAVFVSYEASHPELSRAARGEKGVDALQRLWIDMRNSALSRASSGDPPAEGPVRGFEDFAPETREALNGLVEAVVRDYVRWWYTPIVPSDRSFPLACRKTLSSFVISVSNHVSRKRPADAFLDLLTNSSSIIIVFLTELSVVFAETPADSKMNAADAIYGYLANSPESHLANLLNQRQQASKFRMVSDDLLSFVERSAYDCSPVRVFLREILAGTVLEMALQTCSNADWINGWIVHLLEAGEPDISQAIDAGMQKGPTGAGDTTFADLDGNAGNAGNAGIAKPSAAQPVRLPPVDADRERKAGTSAHWKKTSKADEEMEEATREMQRINEMIAQEETRRARAVQAKDTPRRPAQPSRQQTPSTPNGACPRAAQGHVGHATSGPGSSSGGNSKGFNGVPWTPGSVAGLSSHDSSPKQTSSSAGAVASNRFTNFDQIVPPAREEPEDARAPLSLHNATVALFDDADGDKTRIKTKPAWDYLIQIEPPSSAHPGWMIARRYADFETLHEILRRIATISGASAFTEQHGALPAWKLHTRASLRGELERYLRDACWFAPLADSEGMRRFLERDQANVPVASKGLKWETVGKNMLDVLTIAPKGAMEGGKTIVGGVTGVLGTMGIGKKQSTNSSAATDLQPAAGRPSLHLSRADSGFSSLNGRSSIGSSSSSSTAAAAKPRDSLDSQRSSVISTQPGRVAPMNRRPSHDSGGEAGGGDNADRGRWDKVPQSASSASGRNSREMSRASSVAGPRSPSSASLDGIKLPPPPDEMPDDYGSPRLPSDLLVPQDSLHDDSQSPVPTKHKPHKQFPQLSEPETRVAVELMFAVINELYTLSSAWNIRRTLLTAAKSFLLRPGNPSLVSIRNLMQESVLDANTSDAGIAAHLRKLRENTMPTDAERATWPANGGILSKEDSEKLRVKARALLIKSGVPAALMGVMGQAATGEALGRVFDCLQVEEVSRGLMFGLILQAMRVVTH